MTSSDDVGLGLAFPWCGLLDATFAGVAALYGAGAAKVYAADQAAIAVFPSGWRVQKVAVELVNVIDPQRRVVASLRASWQDGSTRLNVHEYDSPCGSRTHQLRHAPWDRVQILQAGWESRFRNLRPLQPAPLGHRPRIALCRERSQNAWGFASPQSRYAATMVRGWNRDLDAIPADALTAFVGAAVLSGFDVTILAPDPEDR